MRGEACEEERRGVQCREKREVRSEMEGGEEMRR